MVENPANRLLFLAGNGKGGFCCGLERDVCSSFVALRSIFVHKLELDDEGLLVWSQEE